MNNKWLWIAIFSPFVAGFLVYILTMSPETKKRVEEKPSTVATEEAAAVPAPTPAPVAATEFKPCLPKFKLGEMVYEVQNGWKGQIGIIHPYLDTRNDTCYYSVVMYDTEGGERTDEYWEFQLRK